MSNISPVYTGLLIDYRGGREVVQLSREDGAYVEAGENDNLIVQKLVANPDAVGIFGFSFLDQNGDRVCRAPGEFLHRVLFVRVGTSTGAA